MKKWIFLIAYLVVLPLHILAIENNLGQVEQVTKVLLVPLLIFHFLSQTYRQSGSLKKWIVLALFFSWVGDVLLMFQSKDELYFLIGLGAFLVAHIFYIVYFHNIRIKEKIASRWIYLVIVVIYYAALISWLSPYLGDKRLPVRIYGVAISFMFLLALHMLHLKVRPIGLLMMLGALLFIISDSILAINKFYRPIPQAGVLIMMSYGFAQLLITMGASKYSRLNQSE